MNCHMRPTTQLYRPFFRRRKNGYVPELNAFKANFSAGLSLNIPLFDGYREKNNLRIAKANLESTRYRSENEKRNVATEVIQAHSRLESSAQKVDQFTLQVKQAQLAYHLAQTNYRAGVITNLDSAGCQYIAG